MINISRLLDLARYFVSIEGHNEHPRFEEDMAFALESKLKENKINCKLIKIDEHRWNVMCEVSAELPGKILVFNTHLDTVPPFGMDNPFSPIIENGYLYGRGSVDVRGGLACLCESIISLQENNLLRRGKVMLLATCDEESGSIGARYALRDLKANGAVICEPTEMKLGLAHKGSEWLRVDFNGVSTHSGAPTNGKNAIYAATKFITGLLDYELSVLNNRKHPLTGNSTLNVGKINGGTKSTVVPGFCRVELDRRWNPGETRESVLSEIEEILENTAEEKFGGKGFMSTELGNDFCEFFSMETPQNCDLLSVAIQTHQDVCKMKDPITGLPFWTEASLFQSLASIPAIVVGPGNVKQAHSDNEYVSIDELNLAAEFYVKMMINYCN